MSRSSKIKSLKNMFKKASSGRFSHATFISDIDTGKANRKRPTRFVEPLTKGYRRTRRKKPVDNVEK